MAAAFAPCVASRRIETLLQRRTVYFVVAALGVVLIGGSVFLYGLYTLGIFLIGVAAYLCGLKWKVRGLLLSPFILQFAYLLVLPLNPDEYERLAGVLDNISVGLYSFAFAYFGFLSNRLLTDAQEQASAVAASGDIA